MNIEIRKGEEKDFPDLLRLIKELAEFEKAPEKVLNSVEDMQREKDHINFYLAEADGKAIGYALYFFAYFTWVGKSMYLDDIFIEPQYRGHKIGTRMLEKMFKIAKEEKCKRLRWVVLDWNKKAIDFYKKVGADITGEWLTCDFQEKDIEAFLKTDSEAK